MSHRWTKEDDILVFYLYRFSEDETINENTLITYMGFQNANSIKMRISNFKAVDGKGSLQNYGCITKKVYGEYSGTSQPQHRKKCLEILQN